MNCKLIVSSLQYCIIRELREKYDIPFVNYSRIQNTNDRHSHTKGTLIGELFQQNGTTVQTLK
jgi:hypothetical protein